MNFGDQLKKYRRKNKMSQKILGETLEISRSYLSEVESGKKNPSPELKEKIIKMLEKDLSKPSPDLGKTSTDFDLKTTYKQRIISDMKSLGTYKKEFEQIIDIYADLLVQYRNTLQQYEEEKMENELYMKETGKKPPLMLVIENLRKDIITYSDRLVLNPKSIQGLDVLNKPKSKLAEALSGFG